MNGTPFPIKFQCNYNDIRTNNYINGCNVTYMPRYVFVNPIMNGYETQDIIRR